MLAIFYIVTTLSGHTIFVISRGLCSHNVSDRSSLPIPLLILFGVTAVDRHRSPVEPSEPRIRSPS